MAALNDVIPNDPQDHWGVRGALPPGSVIAINSPRTPAQGGGDRGAVRYAWCHPGQSEAADP